MNHLLGNYRQLIAKVDQLCSGISHALGERITCSEGCGDCCASISIFPVEAAALREALEALPPGTAEHIRQHVAGHSGGECCPLLFDQRCLLYQARPIICRTHGLPILVREDGEQRVDCCPLNLTDGEPLSPSRIIDLDTLNTILVTINTLFLKETGAPSGQPERLTIARALISL